MFIIHAVQAHFGDCLLLEFGTEANRRFILIDGGPADTFDPHLRSALVDKVVPHGGEIERVVLSHVDTDHAIGLLDLMSELRAARDNGEDEFVTIGGLWHNSFVNTIDPDSALAPRLRRALGVAAVAASSHSGVALMGIEEGAALRREALLLGIELNAGVSDPIVVETTPDSVKFGNLTLTVVGPTQANLDELKAEWEAWLEANEDGLLASDPQTLANADDSIPNLSSICLVAEAGGQRALFTGDARSDHVLQGLAAQGLLDADGKAHFQLIKLPHHGSDRNATRTFFRKITADTYLVSANGKNGNPDTATLAWIVEAAQEQGRQIEIVATNATSSTKKLREEYPAQEFGYRLTVRKKSDASVAVVLQ